MRLNHVLGLMTALAPLALPAAAMAAPVVGDASFEAVNTGSKGYVYNPVDAGGWTFGGYSGVATNGSAFGFSNAPGGSNVGFIQSFYGSTGGTISQTITGLTAGMSYTIAFDLAARPSFATNAITLSLAPTAGSAVTLGTFTPASTSFQQASATFTATSSSAILSFAGSQAGATQDLDTAIDLVSVSGNTPATVPEPASVALLGAGVLGLVGALRGRRRAGGLAA